MTTIVTILTPGYADWETALLNAGAREYYQLETRFATPGGEPVTSAGGLKVMPHLAVEDIELDRVDANLRQSLRPGDDIVIWGTGQTVLTTWPETVLRECRIHAFIDSSPLYHGRALGGVQLDAPEALPRYPYPVVIGSVIHEAAIRARIASLGAPNVLISLAGE